MSSDGVRGGELLARSSQCGRTLGPCFKIDAVEIVLIEVVGKARESRAVYKNLRRKESIGVAA